LNALNDIRVIVAGTSWIGGKICMGVFLSEAVVAARAQGHGEDATDRGYKKFSVFLDSLHERYDNLWALSGF